MSTALAIGRYTVAPIWSRPKSGSVMVSQLLLGEPVTVLAATGGYSHVTYDEGREEGFVADAQLLPAAASLHAAQTDRPAYALELFGTLLCDSFGMPVTFGARLPAYDGLQLHHDGRRFLYSGQAVLTEDLTQDPALLLRLGKKWLYAPEMAGGRTPTGVGAGELIQLLVGLLGVDLPVDIASMSRGGVGVDFVEQCQVGDLAFFDDERGKLNHVGLLMPGSRVLHVSGRVRIDAVDHFGVFNLETRRYTHRLRIVKRFLPEAPAELFSIRERFVPEAEDSRQILIF